MPAKSSGINLLNPINPPSDIWTTIYTWVTTVGRFLLIGVEALLLVVFFTRFTMDEIKNNLTEEINDKVDILSNSEFRSQEIRYQNLHLLFGDIVTLKNEQPINSTVISELLSSIPSTLRLDGFSFNDGRVNLAVTATELKPIKDYEFSLRQNTKYENVNITVSKRGANSADLDVSISFNLKVEESGQGS